MPRDAQISNSSSEAAPKDYTIPGNAELVLRAVTATFTDNGASGDWLPCLTLISDSGHTIARACDPNVKVTAGGDAEVSWFPGVKSAAATAAASGVAASAYLWTQTVQTFTGSTGFAATWDHFQTTDTAVFGTDPFNNVAVPPHNTAGDVNLVLLKDGAYIAQGTVVPAVGTTNIYAELFPLTVNYQPDTHPTSAGAIASVTSPVPSEGRLQTFSEKVFTLTPGFAPAAIYLQLKGVGAGTYTLSSYSIVCHYLGPGIGADHVVY